MNKEEKKKNKKPNIFKLLSKKRKALLVLLGTFILLVTALVIYFFVFYKKPVEKHKDIVYEVITKDNYKYSNGVLTLLDDDDNEIGTYNCRNKDENNCYVAYELGEDNFDETRSYYENNELVLKRSKFYYARYAFIHDTKEDDEIVLYDYKDKKEVGTYKGIKSFYNKSLNMKENNYVILVNSEGLYGLYDLDNDEIKTIIEPTYSYLGVINKNISETDNRLVYKNNDEWGIIDFKNKQLFKTNYEIRDFNLNYVKVIDENDLYDLYKYDNTLVFEDFTYIDTFTDYLITITNNKYLNIYNNDLVRLVAEPITIRNNGFVPKKIFNSDKTLVEEKKSYELSVLNNTMYLNVIKCEEKIEYAYNLLDGKLSFLYDYYSYQNGVLYFYKDLEKTELIGTYSCTNKNILTDSSTSFNNCHMAIDASSENKDISIPIYLNRYVFVYDAPSLVNETTVKTNLYDLQEKKVLVSYIDAFSNTKASGTKGNTSHVDSAENYIIAIRKDGKYGVIKIDTTTTTKTVPFEYDDIKSLKSYLMGKTGTTWKLIDYNNKAILDGSYLSFDLREGYIFTVDASNNLLLHNYENKTLINTPILLTSPTDTYNFAIYTDVYKITVNGVTYEYNRTTGDIVE